MIDVSLWLVEKERNNSGLKYCIKTRLEEQAQTKKNEDTQQRPYPLDVLAKTCYCKSDIAFKTWLDLY